MVSAGHTVNIFISQLENTGKTIQWFKLSLFINQSNGIALEDNNDKIEKIETQSKIFLSYFEGPKHTT